MKLSHGMLVLGIVVAVAAALSAVAVGTPAPQPDLAGAVIKLTDATGHGSGVHIGNGYVLTAAHVPAGKKQMAYGRDDGLKGTAAVVWSSAETDIALMRLDTADGLAASALECRAPAKGEAVALKGNPLVLDNITTWGRVAGDATELGPWANVLPVDGAIAGGMSGGGAFDADGDLIGISVGMMVQPMGVAGTSVGIALIVPGSTICGLLARDV